MPVSADYLSYVLEQLAGVRRVSSRRMFSGVGLYAEDLFFGLIHDDTLFLKTDTTNAPDYDARGMRRFNPFPEQPARTGASMGYHEVPVDVLEDSDQLGTWARKSIAVALTAAVRKSRSAGRRALPRKAGSTADGLLLPEVRRRAGGNVNDPYNLQRFVDAQRGIFAEVCAQLREGCKTGHWMWFIFPQLEGLGHSELAERFAISSRAEAAAYLQHCLLGPRLRECTRLVSLVEGRSIVQILGHPDDLKFCSSMTLFAHSTSDNRLFLDALEKYCGGRFDALTLGRL